MKKLLASALLISGLSVVGYAEEPAAKEADKAKKEEPKMVCVDKKDHKKMLDAKSKDDCEKAKGMWKKDNHPAEKK